MVMMTTWIKKEGQSSFDLMTPNPKDEKEPGTITGSDMFDPRFLGHSKDDNPIDDNDKNNKEDDHERLDRYEDTTDDTPVDEEEDCEDSKYVLI